MLGATSDVCLNSLYLTLERPVARVNKIGVHGGWWGNGDTLAADRNDKDVRPNTSNG